MMQDFAPCRLCAEYNKSISPISLFEKSRKSLLHRIFLLTGVKLRSLNNIPSVICLDCETDLNSAYEFRSRCIAAQEYFSSSEYKTRVGLLRERQSQLQSRKIVTVRELSRSKENETTSFESEIKSEESCNRNSEDWAWFASEFIALNEIGCTDTKYGDMKVIENQPTDCKTLKLERFHSKEENTEGQLQNPICENERGQEEATSEPIDDVLETDPVIDRSKITKSAKKQSKVGGKNQSRTFICDQCGNNFSNRSHFYEHVRRHNGVKSVQCEVCPNKFFTESELKRHMRRHTGERPFPCKYCQRRFTDYSSRIKHERTHTNERPFKCPQCDKAFTRSYILKNHMLVHTGQRSFICVPCNKSFQRQTNLDVHTRSLSHKQNVGRELHTLKQQKSEESKS